MVSSGIKLMAVPLRCDGFLFGFVAYQFAFGKFGNFGSAVAVGLYDKRVRKRINRLGTHTIQAHRFLEGFAVVLTTGIYFGYAIDHFTQRNAAAIIAHGTLYDRSC